MRARLFAAAVRERLTDQRPPLDRVRSVESALMAQPHHLVDEGLLLLAVQARIERLGGVGDVALVGGAGVEKLRLVADLFDDVVRRVALGARDANIQPLWAVVTQMVHRAVESAAMLLL